MEQCGGRQSGELYISNNPTGLKVSPSPDLLFLLGDHLHDTFFFYSSQTFLTPTMRPLGLLHIEGQTCSFRMLEGQTSQEFLLRAGLTERSAARRIEG